MCVLLGLNVENNEQTGWAAGRQVLSWILFAETAKLKQERGTTGGSVTAWKRDTSKTPVHSHEERLVKNEEPGRENGGGRGDESVYSYHPHQTSSWQTNTCRSVWEASRLIGKDTCHTHRLSSIRRGYSKSICEKLTPSSLSSSEDDHVGQEWKPFKACGHKKTESILRWKLSLMTSTQLSHRYEPINVILGDAELPKINVFVRQYRAEYEI